MGTPRLSIVVAGSRASGPPAALFETLRSRLHDGSVEVIIATARPAPSNAPALDSIRELRHRARTSVPRLRSAGFAAARAPIVALTEDFCVPAERWVDALLAAHAEHGASTIGGPIERCEGRPVDWALTLLEYGRFFDRARRGAVTDLPGTNVSYDRARVERSLGEIPKLWIEVTVHERLRQLGEQLWCEPEAVMLDVNRLAFAAALRAQFHHGRLYGGMRRETSVRRERVWRVLIAPLVPIVLARRARSYAGHAPATALPALLALSGAWALGEAIGWLVGEGRSRERWI